MFSSILSCINALTISPALPAGLTLPDLRFIAAQLLGLAADNGTIAARLEDVAAETEQPAGVVLAVLQALAAAGLVVFGVVPVSGGAWVVAWFVGWSGGALEAVVTGNISSEGASLETKPVGADGSGCLFVCSSQSLEDDLNIKTNKQTAHAHAHAREGAASGSGAAVTGNISSEKARIVALLTDPAVVAGLVVRSSGQVVGAMDRDKARDLAAELVKAGRDFSFVLGNVCEWRRQVDDGRVFSPLPALVARLRRGFDGSITEADRALAWFQRHAPEDRFDLWAAAGMSAPDLPAVVDAAPAAGAVVSPCDRSVITGNISSDEHAAAWDRFLAWLRTVGDTQTADLLDGSQAAPSSAGAWVVRLGWRGGALAINGGKRAGRLGADLAAFLGAPAPLAVEFVAGD